MKKRLGFTLALCMILGMGSTVLAASTTATPSNASMTIDGADITIGAYNIDGYTYYKLRDIAAALDGTDANFAVGYDSTAKSISLTSATAYTATGSELGELPTENASAEISTQSILLDGAETSLQAYNIGGYNYFKLQDLGTALGFGVHWDADTRTIDLSTVIDSSPVDEDTTSEVVGYSAAALQQLIDESISGATTDIPVISVVGDFYGAVGDTVTITEACQFVSLTGASLNNIILEVDTDETVYISGITFNGNGADQGSLHIINTGKDTTIDYCTFNDYQHEAVLINKIPITESLYIQHCAFNEYGLAEGGIDSAICLESDVYLGVLLSIRENTFTISRNDVDMTPDDMDVAFMTATTKEDVETIFGQLNLYFENNVIYKGTSVLSVDVYACYRQDASSLI
ncbi:stalk domain-containing protein [Chakrabartyella piscis]|uniref:stalk domain-containing protein n=1 Tax=Chakrabartyella piscis TaxID=2918914 RepID=UPI0029588F16|nr:stalk domain-containing protein [Chakrabartyella piscis]